MGSELLVFEGTKNQATQITYGNQLGKETGRNGMKPNFFVMALNTVDLLRKLFSCYLNLVFAKRFREKITSCYNGEK